MKYVKIDSITKKEFQEKEKVVNSEKLCLLLYGISEVEDWRWVQNIYCRYLDHDDKLVVLAAIKGFSDLARISHNLDKNKVIHKLKNIAIKNDDFKEIIMDVIDDINIFIKNCPVPPSQTIIPSKND